MSGRGRLIAGPGGATCSKDKRPRDNATSKEGHETTDYGTRNRIGLRDKAGPKPNETKHEQERGTEGSFRRRIGR